MEPNQVQFYAVKTRDVPPDKQVSTLVTSYEMALTVAEAVSTHFDGATVDIFKSGGAPGTIVDDVLVCVVNMYQTSEETLTRDLITFARNTILTLQDNQSWGPSTFDVIGIDAIDLGLGQADADGFFEATQRFKQNYASV